MQRLPHPEATLESGIPAAVARFPRNFTSTTGFHAGEPQPWQRTEFMIPRHVAVLLLSVFVTAFIAAAPGTSWGAEASAVAPTHVEVEPIRLTLPGQEGRIETLAMDSRGRLIVGVSWITAPEVGTGPIRPRPQSGIQRRRPRRNRSGEAARNYAIRIVAGDGRELETWPLNGVTPKMLHGCEDGTVIIGGAGRLVRFDAEGRLLTETSLKDILNGKYAGAHVSGLTASREHVFVAFGFGDSLRATEDIVILDRDFRSPKVIVERQFGCCSHIDLDVQGDVLLVAENSRHRVNRFTFGGKPLGRWGHRDRTGLEGFAACCNPVNFDFGPDDVLYTAESGIGRVKRYTSEGEFLGLAGYVDTTKFDQGSRLAAQSCYIPVEVAPDGDRIYVMDVRAHIIRVLARKIAKNAD